MPIIVSAVGISYAHKMKLIHDFLNYTNSAAFQQEFSILPVTTKHKKLLGYVKFPISDDLLQNDAPVASAMIKFARKVPYTLITPDTDLDSLKKFFKSNVDNDFAIVTNPGSYMCMYNY